MKGAGAGAAGGGEYLDSKAQTPTSNMFSKLHHHHSTNTTTTPHPFHFQLSPQSQTHDSDVSASRRDSATGGDGATIEVVRRPRGRPPGSKNKPKPPVIITREPDPGMSPYILEVTGGNDIVEAISRFSSRKNIGICVLTGSGTVSNVTLRQPSATPGATITFHGRFEILSLSATFVPHAASFQVPNSFSISLAGPQGQIVGGFVAGALIAAGTVFVVAATFNNPSFHRLPSEEEARTNTMSSSGGGGGEGQSPPLSAGGGDSTHGGAPEVPMYSCHMGGPDVIWAPTARPPPPPPY